MLITPRHLAHGHTNNAIMQYTLISKLSERAGAEQYMEHLTANNLHSQLQSAYKQQNSTETALLKTKNVILMSINEQHATLLVLLDLSAAFDTIHHHNLIGRLESDLGITDNALAWFKSHLSDRFQRVSVNGSLSDHKNKVFLKDNVWAPCFSLSTRANRFRSLNVTTHKLTATRTKHNFMYHSAPIDLRMLILPSSP